MCNIGIVSACSDIFHTHFSVIPVEFDKCGLSSIYLIIVCNARCSLSTAPARQTCKQLNVVQNGRCTQALLGHIALPSKVFHEVHVLLHELGCD